MNANEKLTKIDILFDVDFWYNKKGIALKRNRAGKGIALMRGQINDFVSEIPDNKRGQVINFPRKLITRYYDNTILK